MEVKSALINITIIVILAYEGAKLEFYESF